MPFENPILIAMLQFLAGSAARPFSFCEFTRAPCCDFWPAQLPAHFHACEFTRGGAVELCSLENPIHNPESALTSKAKCANLINSKGKCAAAAAAAAATSSSSSSSSSSRPLNRSRVGQRTARSPRRAARSLRSSARRPASACTRAPTRRRTSWSAAVCCAL